MFDRMLFTAEWKFYINGKELDEKRRYCIESFTLNSSCSGSDTLSFTVNDPEFIFLEDNIFIEDATVKLEFNLTKDINKKAFEGYISTIDVSFPESGFPVLDIFCLDKTHLMNRKKKKRTWDNVTNADVVQKIGKEYGFNVVIESNYEFELKETISQSEQTDIEFLDSLVREERDLFMCKLKDNTLYYIKKKISENAKSNLIYRSFPYDIRSIDFQITKETKKEEVEKSDINTSSKKIGKSISTNTSTVREQNGISVNTSSSPVSSNSSELDSIGSNINDSLNSMNDLVYNTETGYWESGKKRKEKNQKSNIKPKG